MSKLACEIEILFEEGVEFNVDAEP